MSRESTMKSIRADEYVVRLKDVCKTVSSKLPIERLLKEGASLHTDRTSRALFKHALSPTALYEARLKDMSSRARLTEIRVGLTKQQSILSASLSEVKSHIMAKYASEIQAAGSTVEMRKAYLEKALNFGVTLLDEINAAVEEIDLYIKDIDHAAFGFRDATDLIKLITERRDQVV